MGLPLQYRPCIISTYTTAAAAGASWHIEGWHEGGYRYYISKWRYIKRCTEDMDILYTRITPTYLPPSPITFHFKIIVTAVARWISIFDKATPRFQFSNFANLRYLLSLLLTEYIVGSLAVVLPVPQHTASQTNWRIVIRKEHTKPKNIRHCLIQAYTLLRWNVKMFLPMPPYLPTAPNDKKTKNKNQRRGKQACTSSS